MAEEGLNRVLLIGRLGKSPELRYTQSGQPILNLRLATTESYVDRDKERQERTEWHSVVMWGRRGEALDKFLDKGSKICVEGRLQTRSWEGKDGGKRYSTEVVATNIVLLGGGKRRDEQRNEGPQEDVGGNFGDDDIPFGRAEQWGW